MMQRIRIRCLIFVLVILAQIDYGQTESQNFLRTQLSFPRVEKAFNKYNDSLNTWFQRKHILYPPHDIYLRVFKAQNELEVWARENEKTEYRFIKLFHVCAMSGYLGPKRYQGDKQVPEGCYFIQEFNPQSEYYLSLKINYPNYADQKVIGNNIKTGGDIFIHGGCVTIGCLPMTNEGIQQLYILCMNAKTNGAESIPIHIFPTRFTKNGINYLKREYSDDPIKQQFWAELKPYYDYFEKYHQLLPVLYSEDGRYLNNLY